MGRRHASTLIAAALAGLWGAGLALPHWRGGSDLLDRVEAPLADLRFLIQGPRPAPDAITIVAIDDQTIQTTGSYPLPRATMAQLVSSLALMKPNVIALDILFIDPGPPQGDLALAEALRKSPSVVAAAGVFKPGENRSRIVSDRSLDTLLPEAESLLLPLGSLTGAAALGVVNIAIDASGVPRHVPLLLQSGDRIVPSFPLRAASLAVKQDPVLGSESVELGGASTRTETGYALPLRFYGPGGTIRTVSAAQVLNGTLAEDAIGGRTVVIGATVTGGGDTFSTPFDPVLPGVEVLATAIAHLTEGDGLVRDRSVRTVDAAVAVILPVLFVLLLSWQRSAWGFALIASSALGWIGVTVVAFTRGIWLSASLPLLAAVPAVTFFGAAQLWLDRRRADRLSAQSKTLQRFQPPSLTERLTKDPAFLMQPIRQEAAVIFIDLSGFTGMTEMISIDETREVLRSFHTLVDEEAVAHHGIVASFMGDGAMILFGLPDPSPHDAGNALAACLGLCARMEIWLASLPEPIATRIGFKIGAHHGGIIASRLGGDSHQHITATGDTVNVASRLMEVAATHQADIAMSDDLLQAAGPARIVLRSGSLDGPRATAIRGRAGAIPAWLWRREPPRAR
ncbi:adenylate/guanylate cyclase domain-containing protein [Microvirga sp. HBU67558]|uniref:CHASE2 domain-containing protein n=1 Tax=Microvirga TaxID=186650 RepID=UPI001B38D97E|nr:MULTISPECIES: adenylate/guanylate cyclase domain-containing protein [unclassified Microvirga]MBQ0823341.1 adenylate/guanylate cyclase domain-containing protein [Microvirga sp. HBU67558]